jgi:hypothetical protein
MFAASVEPGRVTVVLSIDELRLLNNALNEVVNGVDIPGAAFNSRLGATRQEATSLLASVHGILDSAEEIGP